MLNDIYIKIRFYVAEKNRLEGILNYLENKLEDNYLKSQNAFNFEEIKISKNNKRISNDYLFNKAVENIELKEKIKKRKKQLDKIINDFYMLLNKIEDIELKNIVEYRYLYNMTYKEISEKLYISKPTISRRLKEGGFI